MTYSVYLFKKLDNVLYESLSVEHDLYSDGFSLLNIEVKGEISDIAKNIIMSRFTKNFPYMTKSNWSWGLKRVYIESNIHHYYISNSNFEEDERNYYLKQLCND